jgi:hypothetical protein
MNKELIEGFAWGGSIVALAIGATLAHKLGYIEADTVQRVIFGSIGLMVAGFGNRIPKAFVASAQARRAKRVAGWSMVLSGLIYAALWVLASFPVATWGGFAAILAGIAVTMGYCLSLPSKTKAAFR